MTFRPLPAATLALGLLAAPLAAMAQEKPLFGQERVGLELNLGAGISVGPAYPGSSTTRAEPLPYINGGYGEWLDFDVQDGIRLSALRAYGFSAGPILRLREGREASNARRNLAGLRSFSDTVEGGAFIGYEAGPFSADVTATQDLAHSHGGAALEARMMLSAPIGRVAISAGPELRVVTRQYAQSYYGITEAEAGRTRYDAYRPGGGLERVGGIVAMQWRITDRWSMTGFVEYARLQGDAADSPLVRTSHASPDQWQASAFLSYRLY